MDKYKFKNGDRVKIRKDCTIAEIVKDYWHGCKTDTIDFIENYGDYEKIFTVKRVYGNSLQLKECK